LVRALKSTQKASAVSATVAPLPAAERTASIALRRASRACARSAARASKAFIFSARRDSCEDGVRYTIQHR
jgi:hypothetical protein